MCRFSKDKGTNQTQAKDINWLELVEATEDREVPPSK